MEFAEAFLRNYPEGSWIGRERERLTSAVDRAAAEDSGSEGAVAMTTQAIHVRGLEKSYERAARAARRGLRRGARQHLRPARLQRRRQDHDREDPVHAAQGRRGDRHRRRLRRRHPAGGRAGVHQPHRAVRRRGRDPHRAGEPGAGGPAAAPEGRRPDRGRPAGPLPAHRRGAATGVDVLRRHAPPSRHRDEPDRGPAGDLPGRADHRPRPAVSGRGVEQRQGARRAGHDGAAHHAVPRRGRASRRPDRDPPRGTDHRERHPRRAEAAPPARRRSSTSRSSRPWRTSSSPSSATTATAAPTTADRTQNRGTTS